MTTLSGVWLPIVTPFLDGAVDFASYERLLEYYLQAQRHGPWAPAVAGAMEGLNAMAAVTDLVVEPRDRPGSAGRRRTNFVLFLGPAIVLTFVFFVIPVLINIAVSFTDLDRTLRITKF